MRPYRAIEFCSFGDLLLINMREESLIKLIQISRLSVDPVKSTFV